MPAVTVVLTHEHLSKQFAAGGIYLKIELVHRRSFRTRDHAREEIFRWIEAWYKTRRHSSIGSYSPADYEELFEQRSEPFGPADPDQPAAVGAVAGVNPLPASNRKSVHQTEVAPV